MMIKCVIFLSFCLFAIALPNAFSQQLERETGYFDNDNLIDTITYKFCRDSVKGPGYQCVVTRGRGTPISFVIPVAFKSLQISDCGKGCLETYQWWTGSNGFEEYNQYKFINAANKWILIRTITVTASGKKRVVIPKDIITLPMGIEPEK